MQNSTMMYPDDDDYDDIDNFEEIDIQIHRSEKQAKVLQEKPAVGASSRPSSAKSSTDSQVTKKKVHDSKCSLIKIYTMLVGLFMVEKFICNQFPIFEICVSRS